MQDAHPEIAVPIKSHHPQDGIFPPVVTILPLFLLRSTYGTVSREQPTGVLHHGAQTMEILQSCQLPNLLDTVAADAARPGSLAHPSAIGACILGPSVGDDLTGSALLTALGTSVGDDNTPSDRRLKQDVRCISRTVFGLPYYEFKYIGNAETHEGVIAQDVLNVMPSAVSIGEGGFYRVNYNALGAVARRL